MDKDVKAYMDRVDPGIIEALGETENFEEVAASLKEEADEIKDKLGGLGSGVNVEQISYLFAMQTQAINKIVDELQELRPAIRFIVSVLLGNEEQEEEGDA